MLKNLSSDIAPAMPSSLVCQIVTPFSDICKCRIIRQLFLPFYFFHSYYPSCYSPYSPFLCESYMLTVQTQVLTLSLLRNAIVLSTSKKENSQLHLLSPSLSPEEQQGRWCLKKKLRIHPVLLLPKRSSKTHATLDYISLCVLDNLMPNKTQEQHKLFFF